MRAPLNFLPPIVTVDVEDWPQSTWDRSLPITKRAADNTLRLVDLLAEEGSRTTMFVLGKFAEAFPGVVRTIHAAGHEVASHGYGHMEIFKQSLAQFREDVRRSKDLLEQTLGVASKGYRAPDFSITSSTKWALEVLAELGFEYDSSIFPIRHSRYGIEDWPTAPHRLALGSGAEIVEIPPATYRLAGRNWPLGGGGYHRLLPGVAFRRLARRAMIHHPFVFYCHPYEIDPLEFKCIGFPVPVATRLHQGLGRARVGQRLRKFLREFGARTARDFLHPQGDAPVLPTIAIQQLEAHGEVRA